MSSTLKAGSEVFWSFAQQNRDNWKPTYCWGIHGPEKVWRTVTLPMFLTTALVFHDDFISFPVTMIQCILQSWKLRVSSNFPTVSLPDDIPFPANPVTAFYHGCMDIAVGGTRLDFDDALGKHNSIKSHSCPPVLAPDSDLDMANTHLEWHKTTENHLERLSHNSEFHWGQLSAWFTMVHL